MNRRKIRVKITVIFWKIDRSLKISVKTTVNCSKSDEKH